MTTIEYIAGALFGAIQAAWRGNFFHAGGDVARARSAIEDVRYRDTTAEENARARVLCEAISIELYCLERRMQRSAALAEDPLACDACQTFLHARRVAKGHCDNCGGPIEMVVRS